MEKYKELTDEELMKVIGGREPHEDEYGDFLRPHETEAGEFVPDAYRAPTNLRNNNTFDPNRIDKQIERIEMDKSQFEPLKYDK